MVVDATPKKAIYFSAGATNNKVFEMWCPQKMSKCLQASAYEPLRIRLIQGRRDAVVGDTLWEFLNKTLAERAIMLVASMSRVVRPQGRLFVPRRCGQRDELGVCRMLVEKPPSCGGIDVSDSDLEQMDVRGEDEQVHHLPRGSRGYEVCWPESRCAPRHPINHILCRRICCCTSARTPRPSAKLTQAVFLTAQCAVATSGIGRSSAPSTCASRI